MIAGISALIVPAMSSGDCCEPAEQTAFAELSEPQ